MIDDQPDVLGYLERKGWAVFKKERGKSGDHVILKRCPYCGQESKGAKRTFYINVDSGLWNSYCCDKKGNMLILKRDQGDLDIERSGFSGYGTSEAGKLADRLRKARGSFADLIANASTPPESSAPLYHKRLMDNEADALEYLMVGRGFKSETAVAFSLGVARRGYCQVCQKRTSVKPGDVCPWCDGAVNQAQEMIATPYRVDGNVVNFKFRSITGDKRFEMWGQGAPDVPFNLDSLDGEFKAVVICEAEFDAITVAQLGYKAVISTGGATKNLDDELVERLALFDDVLLGQDADEAGDKAAEKLAQQLGRYRCRRIKWPMKDANDCLRSGMSPDDLCAVIDAASSYQVNAVKPFGEFADDLRKMRNKGPQLYGRQTQWLGVNWLLAGLRDGEMTVITGDTGSGKTTWTLAMALDQAIGDAPDRDPVGVLAASFEVPIPDVCRKLVCMDVGKAFRKPNDDGTGGMSDGEFEDSIRKLSQLDFFFVDQYGEMALSDLRDAIEYGVRRYGLWLVVLDHLHFFLPSGAGDERKIIDDAIRTIKKWAVRLGIHIALVVHPSKLRTDQNGKVLKVELNDLKGSSAIKQDADNVIRVWRPRGDDFDPNVPAYAEIAMIKIRSDFGREGEAVLDFDPVSMRYTFSPSNQDRGQRQSSPSKKRNGGRSSKKKPEEPKQESTPQPQTEQMDFDAPPKKLRLIQGDEVIGTLEAPSDA